MRDPRLVGSVRLPTIKDAVKAGGFLAGRLEDIIEAPKGGRDPGLDRVFCATPFDVQREDLDRFAKSGYPGLSRPHDHRRSAVGAREPPGAPFAGTSASTAGRSANHVAHRGFLPWRLSDAGPRAR